MLGSPFPGSSSEKIANIIINRLDGQGWDVKIIINLAVLPANSLLMREECSEVDESVREAVPSDFIIPASPTYRATYTGLLKAFFDLLPTEALRDKVVLAIQTGGLAEHSLTIEHGMAPMLRSLGATVLTESIYAWRDHWKEDHEPSDKLKTLISKSMDQIYKAIE